MTKPTRLRIALTLGAIVGIVPATLMFVLSLPMLVSAVFYSPASGWIAAAILASLIGLWGSWGAYKMSMASRSQPAHDWRLVAALVVAIACGLTWSAGWGWDPWMLFAFLMPGLTGGTMLGVTALRARQID